MFQSYLTQLANSSYDIDLSNHSYRAFYKDDHIKSYAFDYLKNQGYKQTGFLAFLIIYDNKIPVAHCQNDGRMPGEDDCDSCDEDGWHSRPRSNSLWARKGGKCYRVGTLQLPKTGILPVMVCFQATDIFGENIPPLAHSGLLIFDAEAKHIDFFEPNGTSSSCHKRQVIAVSECIRTLVPTWSFRDVGDECCPHHWYKFGYGVCALWTFIYMMLRLDGLAADQVASYLKDLDLERAGKLTSGLMVKIWQNESPKHYRSLLRDHQIPNRYLDLLLEKIKERINSN